MQPAETLNADGNVSVNRIFIRSMFKVAVGQFLTF